MQKTTVIAKITRPSVSGVLDRKRLFRLLDRGLRKPALWVGGPAGSGKTTLVNSYLKARGLPCIWYQADPGDSDIATFFYYMGLAAKRANPRRRKPMPLLTPEYMMGVPAFTLRYFEELYSRLRPPYVVVIDNYQEVPEVSPFHEVIQAGVLTVPEGITVVLASRVEPPKEFARLRANNMVSAVGWSDLRLTEKESNSVARLHKKKPLSRKALKEYYQQSDGWVAGLVLLMEKAGEAGIDQLKGRAPHEVFDYFAGEIFEKSDKQTQSFLKKTSLLPFITPLMAEGITGIAGPERMLEGLSRNNFFTVRRRGGEPSYQYHPLFREFLTERAKVSMPPEEFAGLEARAAAVLDEAGYAEDAAGFYISSGRWEGLIGLIMKQAMAMLMQGRSHVLEEWLKKIPEEIFRNMPWLQYWMGACRLPFNPAEAEGYFKDAFEGFDARNDPAGVFLSWSGVVDSIFYGLDSFRKIDPWIDMIDGLVERFGGYPSEEIETRVTASMYFSLIMRRPEHPGFERWQARALELAEKSPDVNLKVHIIAHYTWFCFFIGDSTKAVPALDGLKDLLRFGNVTPFSRMTIATAAAMQAPYTTTEADYEALAIKCLKTVDDALVFSRRTGVHVLDFQMTGTAVWSAALKHDFASVDKYLARMKAALSRVKRFDSGYYHSLLMFMELEKGNLQAALKYVEAVIEDMHYTGGFLSDFGGGLSVAQVKCEAGDHEEALEYASDVRRLGKKIKTPYLEYMALIAEAHIQLGQGRDEEGLSCLRKAMAIGREQGYFNHLLWRQGIMARLCLRALEEGIETEHVKKLIRVRKLMPDEPPVHIEDWPWPVRIYTMGRFEVLIDDRPLSFTGKAQRKPIGLLKAVVALSGAKGGVKEETVSDALWPHADGDSAHIAFTSALYRLRKLLSGNDAVILRDGRLRLNPALCWVDALVMEKLFDGAAEGARPPAISALRLYKGRFLAEDAAPYAVSARERLRSKYLKCLSALAGRSADEGKWERAAELYGRGFEEDPLSEEFCRGLMLMLSHSGRSAEAASAYGKLEAALREAFDIGPSKRTEALFKKIISQ